MLYYCLIPLFVRCCFGQCVWCPCTRLCWIQLLSRTPTSGRPSLYVHANTVKVQKGKNVCFSFRNSGVCSRKDCRFSHTSEGKSDLPSSSFKAADVSASAPCGKCGERHTTKSCKFAGKCSHCGILGHKEEVCMKKKAGKPKAMHLNADGFSVCSNSVLLKNRSVQTTCTPTAYLTPAPIFASIRRGAIRRMHAFLRARHFRIDG